MSIVAQTDVYSFTVENYGTVTYSDSAFLHYTDANAIFNNESGGVVNLENAPIFWGAYGDGTFNNRAGGTVENTSPAGTTSSSDATFNNAGTVKVMSGELLLVNGGTQTGAFDVASGAEMSFNGAHAWNSGVSFAGVASHGTGTFHVGAFSNVGGTTTTVTTNVSVPNLTIDSNDDVFLDSGTTLTVTGR